jgi:hypothetical protein
MKRIIEWVLAGIGTIMCVGGAASTWVSEAGSNSPADSLWPLPALVLIEVAILGLVGFSGVVLDTQRHSSRWGRVLWIACGGLTALAIIGAFSVSVLVLLAAPALFFGGAAVLADIRQHRNMRSDLGLFTIGTVANLTLIFALISIARI